MRRHALTATFAFALCSSWSAPAARAQSDDLPPDESWERPPARADEAVPSPSSDAPQEEGDLGEWSGSEDNTSTQPPAAPADDTPVATEPVSEGSGADAAAEIPSATPAEEGAILDDFRLEPFATLVGGFQVDHRPQRTDMDDRNDRFTTMALSRLGLRAAYGDHLSLESEIEVNSGPFGTSVWEGQGALQIRNQLIRLTFGDLELEAGRITDPTSLDYFATYVANTLLTDPFTRNSLLISGFNRGNGVLARYRFDDITVGMTVNAGNPTSTTGTVMIGGTFPPFERFYQVPWADVGRDARGFPTESFQAVLVSPSVTLDLPLVRAQASFQYFVVDTNTNTTKDEAITGYNLRAGAQLKLLDDKVHPFLNVSRVINDMVNPNDLASLSGEYYMAVTATAGIDWEIYERSGIGAQYAMIIEDGAPENPRLARHYLNVGGSYWFLPYSSVDVRYGALFRCEDDRTGSGFDCRSESREEEHVVYLTLKAILGPTGSSGRRP